MVTSVKSVQNANGIGTTDVVMLLQILPSLIRFDSYAFLHPGLPVWRQHCVILTLTHAVLLKAAVRCLGEDLIRCLTRLSFFHKPPRVAAAPRLSNCVGRYESEKGPSLSMLFQITNSQLIVGNSGDQVLLNSWKGYGIMLISCSTNIDRCVPPLLKCAGLSNHFHLIDEWLIFLLSGGEMHESDFIVQS